MTLDVKTFFGPDNSYNEDQVPPAVTPESIEMFRQTMRTEEGIGKLCSRPVKLLQFLNGLIDFGQAELAYDFLASGPSVWDHLISNHFASLLTLTYSQDKYPNDYPQQEVSKIFLGAPHEVQVKLLSSHFFIELLDCKKLHDRIIDCIRSATSEQKLQIFSSWSAAATLSVDHTSEVLKYNDTFVTLLREMQHEHQVKLVALNTQQFHGTIINVLEATDHFSTVMDVLAESTQQEKVQILCVDNAIEIFNKNGCFNTVLEILASATRDQKVAIFSAADKIYGLQEQGKREIVMEALNAASPAQTNDVDPVAAPPQAPPPAPPSL